MQSRKNINPPLPGIEPGNPGSQGVRSMITATQLDMKMERNRNTISIQPDRRRIWESGKFLTLSLYILKEFDILSFYMVSKHPYLSLTIHQAFIHNLISLQLCLSYLTWVIIVKWNKKTRQIDVGIKTKLEEYSLEQRAPLLGGSSSRNQYSSEEDERDSVEAR